MAFIEKMVEIQQSLGISFQAPPQGIELMQGGFGTDHMVADGLTDHKRQARSSGSIGKSRSRGNSADSAEEK